MSRKKAHDKSTDVSLFPFLAVLLCTMGSLLVVLVAVTHMSHGKADGQPGGQAVTLTPDKDAVKAAEQLREIKQYNAYLEEVRRQAEEQLRGDQERLSHIEDHIRRLGEKLYELKHAADELAALEMTHTQDREQAEREVERLKKLIAETQESIEELKAQQSSKPRSYAIVPFEGTNGTLRRPIYIECRKNQVILQPEGIELTPDDFLPPMGPGNALASALRAAREQVIRENQMAGPEKQAEPYPLILVRPEGIAAYYRVRDAIESWDADFGYEFIDGDWDLEFPPPNPQLAEVEYRAVELAPARERMLAEAAPRAYGAARSARGGGFDLGMPTGSGDNLSSGGYGQYGSGEGDAEGYGEGSSYGGSDAIASADEFGSGKTGDSMILGEPGGGDYGQGAPSGGKPTPGGEMMSETDGPLLGGPEGDRYAENQFQGDTGPIGGMAEGSTAQSFGNEATRTARTPGSTPNGPGSSSTQQAGRPGLAGDTPSSASGAAGAAGGGSSTPPMDAMSVSQGGSANQSSSQGNPQGHPGVISFEQSAGQQPSENAVANVRGKDWAVSNTEGVPIRRSIQLIVREDRVSILPELTKTGEVAVRGKEIPIKGSTATALGSVVKALQDYTKEWGIAGQGLYWRPVLVINVGPDGQQRANDLASLLENSGMELRHSSTTALKDEGDDANATR